MSEVFENLATGATVPDSCEVQVFGQLTTAITDTDTWLLSLDRFGIVSERAVLLDALTALQNLAMPITLEVEPMAESVRGKAAALGREVGLEERDLARPVGELAPAARLRVRLGRALALDPLVVLSEHPNASLPADDAPAFAADFAKIAAARRLAAVTLTADRTFAAAVAERVLTLQPATGELAAAAGWRRWLNL
jgi:lipoprotein-releasing system ATP-binding protein